MSIRSIYDEIVNVINGNGVVLISKALFITEKPSVAAEFAKALKINGRKLDGYIESDKAIVTWCVGHLVNMSYPEKI